MTVTVNVYFDEKKEKKRRSSFQLHATWFAYIALLPPKHGTRQTHKTQRKEKTAKKKKKKKKRERNKFYTEQQFKDRGKLPIPSSVSFQLLKCYKLM